MSIKYWLFKSEPHVFSFEDLKNSPDATTHWDGVRNYQARNFMRDEMKKGDQVLFYHSHCDEMGMVGVAEVTRDAYPDHTSWDASSKYFDAKSSPQNPRWFMVDITYKQAFRKKVTLSELKATPALSGMRVVQQGQRLSIQPVEKEHFDIVCKMGM
ncbi:MAG: EVE domain-containing protein [bacterium]